MLMSFVSPVAFSVVILEMNQLEYLIQKLGPVLNKEIKESYACEPPDS
jgi:hypothetical protein